MDATHCSNFPPELRARSAEILGDHCLTPDGYPYADIMRPSYRWRKQSSEPVSAVARVGKIKSRKTRICKFLSYFAIVAVIFGFVLWLFL